MFKSSCLGTSDNSGAIVVRIIQKYQYKTNPIGVKALVVLRQYDSWKKLNRKKKYGCLIVASKQKVQRKNGLGIRFNQNRGLLFADKDFDKLMGTRVYGPVGRELRTAGLEPAILQKISANCIFF